MLQNLTHTPLALLNLLHQKARSATAIAGVAFACILLSAQLGLYEAVRTTATMLFDRLDFDLIMLSRQYLDLNRARNFHHERLQQAQAVDGVVTATPIYISANVWHSPNYDQSHRRNIMMLAFQPEAPVFRRPPPVDSSHPDEMGNGLQALHRTGTILIDASTWDEFGPQEPGTLADLGTIRVEMVGRFNIGTGFGYNGMLITSDQTFAKSYGGYPLDYVNMGLIKISKDSDPAEVAAMMNERLPPDVMVLTRAELDTREQDYWMKNTSIGTLVTFGLLVSLIVGTVFVYQVISSDISNRLKEFATLKAIGYPGGYLSKVVLQQAFLLAILGYIPGILISSGLFQMTRKFGGVPTKMSVFIAVAVLVLTIGMCQVSALLALRKAHAADPAELF
jgi:putative ABC transport system permease protein